MKRWYLPAVLLTAGLALACSPATPGPTSDSKGADLPNVALPQPRTQGTVSLEETLLSRRSVREYARGPLTLEEVSQLLWAAQGITADWGGRTAPSAGALHPLEVVLVVGDVERLSPGAYRYAPEKHELAGLVAGDLRARLAAAAVDQRWVRDASISIVIAAVYERTTGKYGERGIRYVHMEAGHAAQNVCLQATALRLGSLTIGAFHDDQVGDLLRLARDEAPLYVVPVGRTRD